MIVDCEFIICSVLMFLYIPFWCFQKGVIVVLIRVYIAVKRHHNHGTSYKEKDI